MGRLAYTLSLIVVFVLACLNTHEIVEVHKPPIPVALFFPSEEAMKVYEDEFMASIDEANDQFEYIRFYVKSVDIAEYDVEYVISKTDNDQYLNGKDTSISVYAVEDIMNLQDDHFEGIAITELKGKWYCNRFTAIVYPINTLYIASHEFGHIFGLQHTNTPKNIMHYANINDDATFSEIQKGLALQQAWSYQVICSQ